MTKIEYRTTKGRVEFRQISPQEYPWVGLTEWQKKLMVGDECRYGHTDNLYVITDITRKDDKWPRPGDTLYIRRVGTSQGIPVYRRDVIPELTRCTKCQHMRTSDQPHYCR